MKHEGLSRVPGPTRRGTEGCASTRTDRRFRLTLLLLIVVIALLNLFSVPAYAAPGWSIVPSPNPAGAMFGQLSGVSCTSTTSCFAVGVFETNSSAFTLTERWNGTTWSIVPSPNPAGATNSQLNGVSCTGAGDCFAVGRSGTRTLIERWDGTTWSIVPSPNPAGAIGSFLAGVSCTSTTSCFAVGAFVTSAGNGALIERWDGTTWSIVPNPASTTDNQLNGVSCTSTTNCFAVGPFLISGTSLIERWDGSTWSIVPSPGGNVALAGVSCTSVTSCFAVGATGNGALIERWDGTKWLIVPSPNPAGPGPVEPQLFAVSCIGQNQCVAVGTLFTTTGGATFIERLHGTKWSIVSSPNPVGANSADLLGVSCLRGNRCVAVGHYGAALHSATLIERR